MFTRNIVNKAAGDIEMPRLHKNREQLGAFGNTAYTSPCWSECK